MKKALVQYFITLSILLLGGFMSQLQAGVQDGIDAHDICTVDATQKGHPSIAIPVKGSDKCLIAELIESEEQEERDENASYQRTVVRNGSDLTAFFYASASGLLLRSPEIGPGQLKPASISKPLRRHIRFQVFLI